MNNEKSTKARLYTFVEMKNAVVQVIADMATESAHDDNYDDPAQVFITEMAVGAKIVNELVAKHEKGEL